MRGGRVLDATGERAADVRVVDGRIAEVGPALSAGAGATVLDADGAIVTPGLVDLQVHFREPGREDAEDVESGARAAALGGCTAVVCMPNTDPPLDDAAVVEAVLERGRRAACDVRVAGCITKGRKGMELAPLGELYDAGVRIFTDDGDCVADAQVMRHAFEYASALAGRGHRATRGRSGARRAAVTCTKARGRRGSGSRAGPRRRSRRSWRATSRSPRLTGGRYHVLHLSAAQSAHLVRAAKAEGVRVTAECTPQHLVLTDERCAGFDPVFKMNPPLREQADVDALRAALLDGTIDAIATDHAPHARETKDVPFEDAPPGMLGVETALAVVHTTLVAPGVLTLAQAFAALSWRPARIAGVDADGHGGPIVPGAPAHLCVFDPNEVWVVDAQRLASRSVNSPWDGWKCTGRVRHTVLARRPDRP